MRNWGNGTVVHPFSVKETKMPRFRSVPFLLVLASLAAAPVFADAAPSPAPSATVSAAAVNQNAGTIDGVVTDVDYTPGRNKMVVKSGAQSIEFVILPGTNVQGASHDFAVDVKVGTHVSVSASKSGGSYTAQIVRVVSNKPAH